ncbi:MAG: CCA tRNA nucleotidyltransferase [Lachnospiraceae bacterium]
MADRPYRADRPDRIEVPGSVKDIIRLLEKHGYEAYAVGGCVRDSLLGRTPADWDITTSARPEQVKSIFYKTVDTGIRHGTITVILKGMGYEVTTFRTGDGHFAGKLEDDLAFRDFSINAMACTGAGEIIDCFGGLEDLQAGWIRGVLDPAARFREDPLRCMRAVRFSAQLGYQIDSATQDAIRECVPLMDRVSPERIRTELVKLLMSDRPGCVRMLYETGITGIFLPEFDRAQTCGQHTPYHCYTVGEHIVRVLEAVCRLTEGKADLSLRMAALLHDLAKPVCKTTEPDGRNHFKGHPGKGADLAGQIMKRLKFDNASTEKVCRLIRWHDIRLKPDERLIRRTMNLVGPDLFDEYLLLQRADLEGKALWIREAESPIHLQVKACADQIRERGDCVTIAMLDVSGGDLIRAGMKPGKEIGQKLAAMLDHVLDYPEDNHKEILMKLFA